MEWNNSTLLTGDVTDAVRALKAQDGDDISVTGSGELIQTLMKHDLIDEYQLLIFPVVLGSGSTPTSAAAP